MWPATMPAVRHNKRQHAGEFPWGHYRFVQRSWLADVTRDALTRAFGRGGIPLGWLPVAVTFYLVRQVVQASDSPRSVAGWGSVLRALAAAPGTWCDELVGVVGAPGTAPTTIIGARHGRG